MVVDVNASNNLPRFGTPHALFHIEPNLNGPYDPAADGQKFLVNSGAQKEGSEPANLVLSWPAELRR